LPKVSSAAIDVAPNEIRIFPFKVKASGGMSRQYHVTKSRRESFDLIFDWLDHIH
jgi:hypothetical protein